MAAFIWVFVLALGGCAGDLTQAQLVAHYEAECVAMCEKQLGVDESDDDYCGRGHSPLISHADAVTKCEDQCIGAVGGVPANSTTRLQDFGDAVDWVTCNQDAECGVLQTTGGEDYDDCRPYYWE